jgi:hypothetical protein
LNLRDKLWLADIHGCGRAKFLHGLQPLVVDVGHKYIPRSGAKTGQ